MADKRKPTKKPVPPPPKSSALSKVIPPAFAQKLAPSFTRMPSDDRAPSGKGGKAGDEGGAKKLTKQQVDAIRLLAITMAGPELADDAVMICNPVGEPAAIPQSELLYDTCR